MPLTVSAVTAGERNGAGLACGTPARFSAEVAATRTLVSRVKAKLGIAPESLAADKACGNGPLLGWLVGQSITPSVPVIHRTRQGESGMKLVRRSIAQLLRDRGVPENDFELQMGHRRLTGTTEPYAAFKPGHLANATREIETVIDGIEILAPGAAPEIS